MYSIEELDLKDDSEQEQIRTRKIFEDIKDRAEKEKPISEHEKDFFSQAVKISTKDDGKLDDYPCCGNFKFKMIYLSYFHDLSGNSRYEKVKGRNIYEVGQAEIKKDILYLSSIAYQWQSTVNTTNHSDELLNHISKEARTKLKDIEKNKGRLIFRKDIEKYKLDKRRTLLYSKYIYCMALQIFELFDSKDFTLNINGEDIEINSYSIIHILSRHYSEIVTQDLSKSYHNNNIPPKYLNKQLKVIFEVIDKSGLFSGQKIDNINFNYNGTDYATWIHKQTKQIRGNGNAQYNRLETFYPIEQKSEREKLKNEHNYHQITNTIGVYVKK